MAYYFGNALSDIKGIKGTADGHLDMSSLPAFARKIIKKPPPMSSIPKDKKGMPDMSKAPPPTDEEGRDIGAMVSILTKAVQELMAVNDEQNTRLKALEEKDTTSEKRVTELEALNGSSADTN